MNICVLCYDAPAVDDGDLCCDCLKRRAFVDGFQPVRAIKFVGFEPLNADELRANLLEACDRRQTRREKARANSATKLTAALVDAVRADHAATGDSISQIAARWPEINEQYVRRIIKRSLWADTSKPR